VPLALRGIFAASLPTLQNSPGFPKLIRFDPLKFGHKL
jgi:hypothetical protein